MARKLMILNLDRVKMLRYCHRNQRVHHQMGPLHHIFLKGGSKRSRWRSKSRANLFTAHWERSSNKIISRLLLQACLGPNQKIKVQSTGGKFSGFKISKVKLKNRDQGMISRKVRAQWIWVLYLACSQTMLWVRQSHQDIESPKTQGMRDALIHLSVLWARKDIIGA